MATYTNLASLSGLSVGDVVNYTTETTINLAGKNIKVELYGKKASASASNGGYTCFNFDSSKLTNKTYVYYPYWGVSFCYSSANMSNIIAIAGDSGMPGTTSGGGAGGGLTGANGSSKYSSNYSAYATGGGGGSQSAGGTGGRTSYGSISSADGRWCVAGTSSGTKSGGAGWYGGGSGGYNSSQSWYGGGGGGSGFIIGKSTAVYPSSHIGSTNSSLTNEIISAIEDNSYSLTQGGSTELNGKMVITILQDSNTLSSITVATNPTKTSYYVGDTFSSAGLTITATYTNGSTSTISSGFTVSSPDMSTAGTKTVTVSYTDLGSTKTTSFNITVAAVVVTSLTLSGTYQTTYYVGDNFDPTGLIVTANYNNGTSAVVNNYTVAPPDTNYAGTQNVTVSYSGVTATYTVTIIGHTHGVYYCTNQSNETFEPCEVYYYTNNQWVKCEVKQYVAIPTSTYIQYSIAQTDSRVTRTLSNHVYTFEGRVNIGEVVDLTYTFPTTSGNIYYIEYHDGGETALPVKASFTNVDNLLYADTEIRFKATSSSVSFTFRLDGRAEDGEIGPATISEPRLGTLQFVDSYAD